MQATEAIMSTTAEFAINIEYVDKLCGVLK